MLVDKILNGGKAAGVAARDKKRHSDRGEHVSAQAAEVMLRVHQQERGVGECNAGQETVTASAVTVRDAACCWPCLSADQNDAKAGK